MFEEEYDCDAIKAILVKMERFRCGFNPVIPLITDTDIEGLDTRIQCFITEKAEKNMIMEFSRTKNFERFMFDVIGQNDGSRYLNCVFNVQKNNYLTKDIVKKATKSIEVKCESLWESDVSGIVTILANIGKLDRVDISYKKDIILKSAKLTEINNFRKFVLSPVFQSGSDAIDTIFKYLDKDDENIRHGIMRLISEKFSVLYLIR